MDDDRAAFQAAQREHALAIAADGVLQDLSLQTNWRSDVHNYSYLWNWLGIPIIQQPTDIVVMQEIIWERRPQVIIEAGVARGGSLILYASVLRLLGEGIVVGIDIDIRPHNRSSIERHPLAGIIHLVEGSSIDPNTVATVRAYTEGAERVMVVLDSDHSHSHVLAELRAYGSMVTTGQFLVVADTIVEYLPRQDHRPRHWGPGNNPATAVAAFLRESDAFTADEHVNAKLLMSSSPGGYLRRL